MSQIVSSDENNLTRSKKNFDRQNLTPPCYEENDSQRLPGDGKQEQSDGRAEGDEGAAEKHRRRHFGSWLGRSERSATPRRVLFTVNVCFNSFRPQLDPILLPPESHWVLT